MVPVSALTVVMAVVLGLGAGTMVIQSVGAFGSLEALIAPSRRRVGARPA